MTVTTRVLSASVNSATADATGRCNARLGPLRAWERWHITILSVVNTSTVKVPEARVYQGSIAPSNLVNGTYAGNRDSDPACDIWLETGEVLIAEWTNGDAGAAGTFTVRGEIANGV